MVFACPEIVTESLFQSWCFVEITSGSSWWKWPGGLRISIFGWTHGMFALAM